MRVTDVDAIPLQAGDHDRSQIDNVGETTLIIVTTDEGITGYGEANVSPHAVRAFLLQPNYWVWNAGIKDALIGEDPRDPAALWDRLCRQNWWSARNGIGHIALAGLDMALWDLAGKAAKKPVWQLLSEGRKSPLPAYITMYEGPSAADVTIKKTISFVEAIREEGFRAAKVEPAPDRTANDREIHELVKQARVHGGEDLTLLCDFCYRWEDAETALPCMQTLEEFDLFLFEAPIIPDNLSAYAQLAQGLTTPIAGAEVLTSEAEFTVLADVGEVDIVQPCVARVGITATNRLAQAMAARDKRLVPYGWVASTISMAATLHVAWANENVPIVEYVPPRFFPRAHLRREIAQPEPEVRDGCFLEPGGPGLGIVVDQGAIEKFRAELLLT